MSKFDFTSQQVRDEVIRLGNEDPDFIYTNQDGHNSRRTCGYAGFNVGTYEGRACIVGQALQNLGVPERQLMDRSEGADTVVQELAKSSTDEDLVFLSTVQEAQDSGQPWGEAIKV